MLCLSTSQGLLVLSMLLVLFCTFTVVPAGARCSSAPAAFVLPPAAVRKHPWARSSCRIFLPKYKIPVIRYYEMPLVAASDHNAKMSLENEDAGGGVASSSDGENNKLPFYLDPGTKGGAVFLSLLLFILPLTIHSVVTNVFGVDGLEAGKWIGVGFTFLATLAWVSTYVFRVATKDMTYAKQLKDYENAVIAKRLEELDEDELQALVEEVERDDF